MPRECGKSGAEGEYDGEQLRHADADDARHVRIVDAGADHGAEPGAVEEDPESDRDDDGDGDDREPVIRENASARKRTNPPSPSGVVTVIGSPPHTMRQKSATMNERPRVTSTCAN